MSVDNLTIAAAIIAVLLSIVAIILTAKVRNTEQKMRKFGRQMMILQSNEKARVLCNKIRAISPELCAGFDFTFKEKDGEIEIEEWNSERPRPE